MQFVDQFDFKIDSILSIFKRCYDTSILSMFSGYVSVMLVTAQQSFYAIVITHADVIRSVVICVVNVSVKHAVAPGVFYNT